MSALVWWLIPLVACTGALIYVWWSIASKRRHNTYKSIAEYENFRDAFNAPRGATSGTPTSTDATPKTSTSRENLELNSSDHEKREK